MARFLIDFAAGTRGFGHGHVMRLPIARPDTPTCVRLPASIRTHSRDNVRFPDAVQRPIRDF